MYHAGDRAVAQGYSKYDGTLYKAGTAVNKIGRGHSSGTLYYGNGSSGYLRGSTVTVNLRGSPYGTLYYKSSSGAYIPVDDAYRDGGSETYYKGNGNYVTGRGSAVDAIEWYGTLYEKGDSVTPVSTPITGLYQADDEENWTFIPIGTPVTDAYQRNPEDDETVDTIGDACSLKLAELTTKDITALTVRKENTA